MRCVLDVNVVVAALLSRDGVPAKLIRLWLDGAFEVIVSPALLSELRKVLAYPKIRRWVSEQEAQSVMTIVRENATLHEDALASREALIADPDDVYLIALARNSRAILVTGDRHLLELGDVMPVESPAAFHERLMGRSDG